MNGVEKEESQTHSVGMSDSREEEHKQQVDARWSDPRERVFEDTL